MDSELKSLTSVETEYLSKSGKKRRQKSFIEETACYNGTSKETTTSNATTTTTTTNDTKPKKSTAETDTSSAKTSTPTASYIMRTNKADPTTATTTTTKRTTTTTKTTITTIPTGTISTTIPSNAVSTTMSTSNTRPTNTIPTNTTSANTLPTNTTSSNTIPANTTFTNARPTYATTTTNAIPTNATSTNTTTTNSTSTNAVPTNSGSNNATTTNSTSTTTTIPAVSRFSALSNVCAISGVSSVSAVPPCPIQSTTTRSAESNSVYSDNLYRLPAAHTNTPGSSGGRRTWIQSTTNTEPTTESTTTTTKSTTTTTTTAELFPNSDLPTTTGSRRCQPSSISNEITYDCTQSRIPTNHCWNQNGYASKQPNPPDGSTLCRSSECSKHSCLHTCTESSNSDKPTTESYFSKCHEKSSNYDYSTRLHELSKPSECPKPNTLYEPPSLTEIIEQFSSMHLHTEEESEEEEDVQEVIRQLSSINIDSEAETEISTEISDSETTDTAEDNTTKFVNKRPRSFILDLIAEEEIDMNKEYKSYNKKDNRIKKTKNKNTDKKRVRKRERGKETNEPTVIDEEIEFIENAIVYDESKDTEFPELQQLFREFNETFFYSQLSSVEVKWSNKMKLCAGICVYKRSGYCCIRLSLPLLKLRKIKEYKETLLHEMIHAYLFLTRKNASHDGHGPEFKKHMYRINKATGLSISIYHSFHDEVNFYRSHVWRCNGICRKYPPQFGFVRRSMNRPPGPKEKWWRKHQSYCNGKYIKVEEKTTEDKEENKKRETDSIENALQEKMKFDEWKKKKEQEKLKQIELNKKRHLKNIKKRNGARVITRNDGIQDAIIVLDSKDFENKKKVDIEESGFINLIQSLFTDHAGHVRNMIFKNVKNQESNYSQKKKEAFKTYDYTITENNLIVID